MKKDDLIYLDHILNSLSKTVDYTEGVTKKDFLNNEEKQDAVIRKIEITGEAIKRVSKELREKYKHIPWKAIAGMRDKLIHDYIDVDLDMVWETATKDVPRLIPQIQAIIDDLEEK